MLSRLRNVLAFGILLALLSTLAMVQVFAQDGGNRVALVIGNANYPDSDTPIATVTSDSRALAEEFRRFGFSVELGANLGRQDMRRIVLAFMESIKPGTTALFYFGGLGLQVARQTYLVPVDAQIWSEADVVREAISLDDLVTEMNRKGAKIKIILIDAARRNPFERRFRPSASGLAPLNVSDGSLALFSAQPGKVMRDEGAGQYGVFANELLKELRAPDQTAEQAFARARMGVSQASNGETLPWLSSSLSEDFFFRLPPRGANTPANRPPSRDPPNPAPVASPAAPARPAPSRRPSTENLIARLAATTPGVDQAARDKIASSYESLSGHKALAAIPGTELYWSAGSYGTPDLAKERVLEACQLRHRNPCALLAVDDDVRAQPSAGSWPRENMPRLLYAGRYDPPRIPILRAEELARPEVRDYAAARGPKAAAIHLQGRLFLASATASQRDAEEQALASCKAQGGT